MLWHDALTRVQQGSGYFIIETSGGGCELLFVDGEMPLDGISVRDAYDKMALLVIGNTDQISNEYLDAVGVKGKYVELNINEYFD